jgi:hypothetical protein
MRALVGIALLGACGSADVIPPSAQRPLPELHELVGNTTAKARSRMVPPEAFLRAYLVWFGGLSPQEVPKRAHGFNLFDSWPDYLAALGLPDYQIDVPRVTQSNTMMLATLGRLGEALCVRSVEHDLHARTAPEARVVFAFEPKPEPTLAEFAPRFDVLHRTFLGYPAELAPEGRIAKFFALYQQVAAHHAASRPLTPDETAWAAVCTALVQHPETELY